MLQTLFPEDVVNVVQEFYMENDGDEASCDLILAIGAQLLDISMDTMLNMIDVANESEYVKHKAL